MKNRYKILLLSDLKEGAENSLRSTISLAKMIDGDISLFHVKSASDIVENDNQLSAMRTINKEYTATNKQLQNLTNPLSRTYNTTINYSFSFGNIKDEIEKYINENKPDIIVLGEKKSSPFSFIGDRITDFVLKTHSGAIMISSDQNSLTPNQEFSLGILNDLEISSSLDFAENLIENSHKPLKSFNIVNPSSIKNESQTSSDGKTVSYVFEKNDNSLKNLSNYVSKNNINLICINREGENSTIKEVINKLKVSLLISSEQEALVQ